MRNSDRARQGLNQSIYYQGLIVFLFFNGDWGSFYGSPLSASPLRIIIIGVLKSGHGR